MSPASIAAVPRGERPAGVHRLPMPRRSDVERAARRRRRRAGRAGAGRRSSRRVRPSRRRGAPVEPGAATVGAATAGGSGAGWSRRVPHQPAIAAEGVEPGHRRARRGCGGPSRVGWCGSRGARPGGLADAADHAGALPVVPVPDQRDGGGGALVGGEPGVHQPEQFLDHVGVPAPALRQGCGGVGVAQVHRGQPGDELVEHPPRHVRRRPGASARTAPAPGRGGRSVR